MQVWNKKQLVEQRLYKHRYDRLYLEIGGRRIEVKVILDLSANIFPMSSVLSDIWRIRKVLRDVQTAIKNFAKEVVAGVGEIFTKPINMIMRNGRE